MNPEFNLRIKLESDYIKFFLLAFLYFTPGIFGIWPVLDSITFIISLFRYIISTIIIFLFILRKIKTKTFGNSLKRNIWIHLMLLILWVLTSDIKNNTDLAIINSVFRPFIATIAYFIIIENSFREKKEEHFFSGTAAYCYMICFLNFAIQLVFPNGLYNVKTNWQPYFLCGNGNIFVFFYLFVMLVTTINCINKNKFPIRIMILDIVLIESTYMAISDTGFAVTLLISVYLLVVLEFKTLAAFIRKWYRVFLTIGIILAFYVIVLGGWNSNFILNFVSSVFSNSAYGFTIRGKIWQYAMLRIIENPIVGGGNGTEMATLYMSGRNYSAHNSYLEIALIGGIPALIIFISILLKPFAYLKKCKDKRYLCGIGVVTGYIIAYMFEQRPYYSGVYVTVFITLAFVRYKRNY